MFGWITRPMSRAGQQSRNTERERERGRKGEGGSKQDKKREGWEKNRGGERERESENVSGLEIKCEQEKPCLLRDKMKRSGKPKQSTKRKTSALAGW